MSTPLSSAMRAALAKVVRAYDAELAHSDAAKLAASGLFVAGLRDRTMDALVSRGMVEIASTYEVHGEEFRRGAFGRWIGGTTRWTEIARRYRPTDAGRAALAQDTV